MSVGYGNETKGKHECYDRMDWAARNLHWSIPPGLAMITTLELDGTRPKNTEPASPTGSKAQIDCRV